MAMMYAPQPLFTTMAADLQVGRTAISLLITVVLLPLAVAPLVYGFFLEAIPPRRVVFRGICSLAALQAGLAAAPGYWMVLALRCAQGLLVPAILTALMTHIGSNRDKSTIQRSMALYIASTIFGAFAGRLSSGFLSSLYGWRIALFFFALLLACCAGIISRLPQAPEHPMDARPAAPSLRALPLALRQPGFLRMYLVVFCAFFVFASLLNFLPFRLSEVAGNVNEFRIATMYSGYLLGIAVCLFVMRIVHFFGNERRAVIAGLLYFLGVMVCFLTPHPLGTQVLMLLSPPGFFLVLAVMPGYLNRLATDHKGLVNGCYLAIYYFGGTLGSWLPGFIYHAYGWSGYVALSCSVLGLGLLLALGMPRQSAPFSASAQ